MNFLLIGRPNVGKSSIYNILINKKNNIVHRDEGTTRNWHQDVISIDKKFYIYDAPGIICYSKKNNIQLNYKLVELLIPKIDYFLFVIDYKSTSNSQDSLILEWIRSFNKKIILLINKKDNNREDFNNEFFKFGIKDMFFLSCTHRIGFVKLRNYFNVKLSKNLKNTKEIYNKSPDLSLAIFGKPNAGKSTFLNKILGYERSSIDIKAGTTTDCVVENFIYKSKKIKIFDTSGIGRKSKIPVGSIDYLSINKSLQTIHEVNCCILLIDSSNKFDRQDKRIINIISNKAKSLIIVFNKFDLIKNKFELKNNILFEIEKNIYQLNNIKIFFISSFSSKQVFKILDYLLKLNIENKYQLSTSKINLWLKKSTTLNSHPIIDRKKVNFKYAVKFKDFPITIKIFCSQPKKIKQSYKRYLVNNFNKSFKILNQNIKLIFSQTDNPYKK